MGIIRFSIKRDRIVWVLLLTSLLGYVACEKESDINWPISSEAFRIFFSTLFSGIISCSIFYLLVTCVPEYRERKLRKVELLDLIHDINQDIRYAMGYFEIGYKTGKLNDGVGVNLQEQARINLSYLSNDFIIKYEKVSSLVKSMPCSMISSWNSVQHINSIKRIRYNQFDEIFCEKSYNKFLNDIENAAKTLEHMEKQLNSIS